MSTDQAVAAELRRLAHQLGETTSSHISQPDAFVRGRAEGLLEAVALLLRRASELDTPEPSDGNIVFDGEGRVYQRDDEAARDHPGPLESQARWWCCGDTQPHTWADLNGAVGPLYPPGGINPPQCEGGR